MQFAFVSTMSGVPWGGSEELWSRTAGRLRQLGHEVDVSLLRWPVTPAPVTRLIADGARLAFRPRTRSLAGRTFEKVRRRLAPSPIDRIGMSWLKQASPELVIISQGGPWDGVPWMTACRGLGLPFCAIVQANSEIWWPEDDWLDDTRSGYGKAQAVFCVSKANRSLLEMQCGTRLVNAEVVVNPWQIDASQAVPWPVDDSSTRIACVGRLDPRAKGQDLLMQVMAMPKWRERPIELSLYGSGPCEESLFSLQRYLGIGNVRFAGHRSDVKSIWAENHALVLPSRLEGLPLVIVEAMLSGRPVITTDVAGNAEYIENGVTGFVAAAPTCSLLDEAMERAWARRGEWETIGKNARAHMLKALPRDPIESFAQRLVGLASR